MLKRFVLFVFLALLPLLLATGLNLHAQYESRLELLHAEAVDVAKQLSFQQRQYIYQTHAILSGLAETIAIQNLSTIECDHFLVDIHGIHDNYLNLGVADTQGDVLCDGQYSSQNAHSKTNIANTSFFKQVMMKGVFSIGPYIYDHQSQQSAFSMGYPVYQQQKLVGVIFGSISLDWWQQILKELQIPANSLSIVADEYHQVIAVVGDTTLHVSDVINNLGIGVDEFEAGSFFLSDERGINRLFVRQDLFPEQYDNSPEIFVGLPTDSVFTSARTSTFEQLAINFAAVAMFLIALLVVFRGSVLEPLRRLAQRKVVKQMPRVNIVNKELSGIALNYKKDDVALLTRNEEHISAIQQSELLFESAPFGIVEWNRDFSMKRYNNKFSAMMLYLGGWELTQIAPLPWSDWPEDFGKAFGAVVGKVSSCLENGEDHDCANCHRNQSVVKFEGLHGTVFFKWHCVVVAPESRQSLLCFVEDITASVVNEDQLRQEARVDELTRLPNRRAMLAEVERCCESAFPFYAGVLQVSDVYVKNKEHGIENGDLLIKQIGEVLLGQEGRSTVIGRWGDCSFFIVLQVNSLESAMNRLTEIKQSLLIPFDYRTEKRRVGVTIGLCGFPEHASTTNEVVEFSELALLSALTERKSDIAIYSPAFKEDMIEREVLEVALRDAVQSEQLSLNYQPIFRASDQTMVSVEALIRWHHPTLGHVSPAKFIPIAEQSMLISEIGWWVLKTAIHQFSEWKKQGVVLKHVAVNLSPRQFSDEMLAEHIRRLCLDAELEPENLTVEMTEYTLFSDNDEAITQIEALRLLGVKVALDDFGTGYSSLSYLSRLQLNYLKIDRSFVMGVGEHRDEQLIDFTLSLASGLDMEVVAEGVETVEQFNYLKQRGCEYIQGYYFAKPMKPEQVVDLFNVKHRAKHDSESSY